MSGDGRSTLEEMVAGAIARGYKVLAVTDHAEGTVSGVPRETLLAQRERFRALQAELGDKLRLLHGVELNIGPAGELDYDLEFRRQFDWCLASVHDHFDLDRAAQTNRVVTAMRDPAVRMIGHLSARMIGGRPPIDLDIDAVGAAAEETGTALEINGALPRLDLSEEALRRLRGRNVTFLLDSDAHRVDELDRARYAALHAARAWVDPAADRQLLARRTPARLDRGPLEMDAARLHLVDGTYELFRAHYAKRPDHRDPSGADRKATVGVVSSLLALLHDADEAVTHIAVAFDNPIRSFRNDLFDGYKSDEGVPPELREQFDTVEDAVRAIGVTVWSMREHEADDGLATGARLFADRVGQVRILTPDKDLGQCLRGDRVVQIDRRQKKLTDEATFRAIARVRARPAFRISWR